jgi:predicted dienelactone hydrolase
MKRIYWFVLSAAAATSLVASACSTSVSGATASVKDTKSYPVASTTITLTDHSRSTPASNGSPALPYRTLSTLVVYPKQPSGELRKFPLIVYSHGFGATAASAMPTLESLASHGYVVAAPDFPLSTTGLLGGLDLLDYVNQPGDVSFVITQMLKLNQSHGSPVYHQIEVHRIGVAGHSLGAVTSSLSLITAAAAILASMLLSKWTAS